MNRAPPQVFEATMKENKDRSPADLPNPPEPPTARVAGEENTPRPAVPEDDGEQGGEPACQMHRFFDLEAE